MTHEDQTGYMNQAQDQTDIQDQTPDQNQKQNKMEVRNQTPGENSAVDTGGS